MRITFITGWLEAAMGCFHEEFNLDRKLDGFVQIADNKRTVAIYTFESDSLVSDVRQWGAAALSCGLVTSFSVEVE